MGTLGVLRVGVHGSFWNATGHEGLSGGLCLQQSDFRSKWERGALQEEGCGPEIPWASCTSCRMRLVCLAGSLGAFAEQEGACEEGGRPGPPLPSRGSSDLSENSPGHQSALPLSRLSPQRCL